MQYGQKVVDAVPPSGYVAVLGRRSPKAAHLVHRLLQANRGVVLVSDPAIFDSLKLSHVGSSLKDIKLKFVNIQGSCQQAVLEQVFKTLHVTQLHILFDEFDFSPVEFHQDISVLFRCLIHMFETIAKNQDTHIFVHATRARHVPSYQLSSQYQPVAAENHSQSQESSSKDAIKMTWAHSGLDEARLLPSTSPTKQPQVAVNHKINSCDPLYDYDFYHDVFMKSVSIYTTTYRNLYDLHVQNVVF